MTSRRKTQMGDQVIFISYLQPGDVGDSMGGHVFL